MGKLFIGIYHLLSQRRGLMMAIMISLVMFIGYSLFNVQITEDVSTILPSDSRLNSVNTVLNNSVIADQIVFHFYANDSSRVDPDSLIEFARPIMEALAADSLHVKSVNFEVAEEQNAELYDYFYQNLPYYLDSADYQAIEANLQPEAIDNTLRKGFMSLVSPAGVATKQYIFKDPLNLVPRVIKRLEKFKMDSNFELYNSHIFTADQKHLLAFITPVNSASKTSLNAPLVSRIDSIVTQASKNGSFRADYFGGTAVAVANANRIKGDVMLTVSLAIAILLIFFSLVIRKVRVVMILFFPVVFGTILSLALLIFFENTISAISLGIGAVLIGINIDYGVHFYTHYRQNPNIKATIREVSLPVMLGSATTAIAFMCLYIIHSEALRQLGLFAAISVVVTTVFVLIFMPLMLRKSDTVGSDNTIRTTIFDRLAAISPEKSRIWVLIVSVITLLVLIFPANVSFNSDISTLNYMTPKLQEAENNLNRISSQTLGTVYMVTKGASVDEALTKMEQRQEKLIALEKEGIIRQRSSATDLMMSQQEQQRKLAMWNSFWDKANRKNIEQLMIATGKNYHFKEGAFNHFYELMRQPFNGITTESEQKMRSLFLKNYLMEKDHQVSAIAMLKIDGDKKAAFYKAFENDPETIAFDRQYIINQLFQVLSNDFSWLVNLSMAFVFLVLLASFGRIELTLVTFVPLLISWYWTLWLMKLVGVEFNIFNVIISTFILGLGDDFCIFMLSGLQDRYKVGHGELTTFRLSALLSSFTVITGIGVLIFAGHPALKSIALVSILGIVAVIIISFTLVPIFFNFLILHRGRPRFQPVTMYSFVVAVYTFMLFLLGALLLTLAIPVVYLLPLKRRCVKSIYHRIIASTMYVMAKLIFAVKKVEIDLQKLNFNKPSVIIANHQSHIDLTLLLKLNPKIIVLTNQWVWNNPFFGLVVRFANYYPVFKGLDHELGHLKQKVNEGYSILVFPEGTRTEDGKINRFHQGAFWLAAHLELDIQPILIHGANHIMYKNEFFLHPGQVTVKALDRIQIKANGDEGSFRHIAKEVRAVMRHEFELLSRQMETPRYFRKQLFSQYIYKGPVLEWYMKVKVKLENDYTFFHQIVPLDAKITDVGCGYGFLSAILAMTSPKRTVHGVDYDELKIGIAKQANIRHNNLSFNCMDISTETVPASDVFIINDVLHYLPDDLQKTVIQQCINQLSTNGMIIIRDADSDLVERTKVTRLTEYFSTKLLKFNKTQYELTYLSGRTIEAIAQANNMSVERIDMAKQTANITFVLRPKTTNEA